MYYLRSADLLYGGSMSLYTIGDLHLSLGSNKSMEVFGGRWTDYIEKLREGFSGLSDDDLTVICGDISWGMSMNESLCDFKFIDSLPGKKIILKGNHDFWWSTATKAKKFFADNGITTIDILHNNSFSYGDCKLCGTRGWFYEESKSAAHDKKMIDREILRLETSLKAAGEREKYVFLHYPPKYGTYTCPEILAVLKQYEAKVCCSGHLHAESLRYAFNGWLDHTEHICVSGDAIAFKPCKIL